MSVVATRTERAGFYAREGYTVARSLFSTAEVERLIRQFMELHARGGEPGKYETHPEGINDGYHYEFRKGDPLAAWPRVMSPHTFMPDVLQAFLDVRIHDVLEEVLGEAALGVYTMFYFKPPGARGQAFHQDNFYFKARPGTCHAAWIALDPSDEGNGGLQVVPRSHTMEIVCPEVADPANYFAKELVRPPEGHEAVQLRLAPGDVLFFHGNLIHGSNPNSSLDRFRRSLICHYLQESVAEVVQYDHPLLNRRGERVDRLPAGPGGPCGTPHDNFLH